MPAAAPVPHRRGMTEQPVPTEEIIAAVYGPVPPPYLAGLWADDRPDRPPALAGYTAHDGRWWTDTGRQAVALLVTYAGRAAG